MAIDTGKVQGRRKLHFDEYEQILAEAERLANAKSLKLLGNWSLGKTFHHLGAAIKLSLDGGKADAPLLARILGPLLKNIFINRPMPAGFKLPKKAATELIAEGDVSTAEGLALLREQLARIKTATTLHPHPAFGRMSPDQYRKLHCRHAELHMSFYVPE